MSDDFEVAWAEMWEEWNCDCDYDCDYDCDDGGDGDGHCDCDCDYDCDRWEFMLELKFSEEWDVECLDGYVKDERSSGDSEGELGRKSIDEVGARFANLRHYFVRAPGNRKRRRASHSGWYNYNLPAVGSESFMANDLSWSMSEGIRWILVALGLVGLDKVGLSRSMGKHRGQITTRKKRPTRPIRYK